MRKQQVRHVPEACNQEEPCRPSENFDQKNRQHLSVQNIYQNVSLKITFSTRSTRSTHVDVCGADWSTHRRAEPLSKESKCWNVMSRMQSRNVTTQQAHGVALGHLTVDPVATPSQWRPKLRMKSSPKLKTQVDHKTNAYPYLLVLWYEHSKELTSKRPHRDILPNWKCLLDLQKRVPLALHEGWNQLLSRLTE